MHSIFSNVEVYINSRQVYNSNGLYAHKSYNSNNFKATISEYRGLLHWRMKLLSRSDGFMLYGKLGIDFFSTPELLSPYMKIRLCQIRARPNFHKISDNPNVSYGVVDCSLHTRRVALKGDYHKNLLAYATVEYN